MRELDSKHDEIFLYHFLNTCTVLYCALLCCAVLFCTNCTAFQRISYAYLNFDIKIFSSCLGSNVHISMQLISKIYDSFVNTMNNSMIADKALNLKQRCNIKYNDPCIMVESCFHEFGTFMNCQIF